MDCGWEASVVVGVAQVKLVVVCPAGAVTGGPEALHQLVHTANLEESGSAAMLYWPFTQMHETPAPYVKYGVPHVGRDQVPESAVVVLPEIWPEMAFTFRNRCALWWLSVDNFGSHGQQNLERISLHLCQSEYAWRFTEGFGERLMLTDWVEVEPVEVSRVSRVVVNPAKDAGWLTEFKKLAGFPIVELRGFDRRGVAEVLRGSTVYVDFGRHPGRDRLPREAAAAGCVVFSTRLGSAVFERDMPLPDWYKFDALDEVLEKVGQVVDGRTSAWDQQAKYRSWVFENKMWFQSEVRALLSVVE